MLTVCGQCDPLLSCRIKDPHISALDRDRNLTALQVNTRIIKPVAAIISLHENRSFTVIINTVQFQPVIHTQDKIDLPFINLKFQDLIADICIRRQIVLLLKQDLLRPACKRHQPFFYLGLIRLVINGIRDIQGISVRHHLLRIVEAVFFFALKSFYQPMLPI